MKYILLRLVILFAGITLLQSCNNKMAASSNNELRSKAFAKKVKLLPTAPVIDVRTPEEFAGEHIAGAINIDWKNENFINKITTVDKSQPVLVYCRSGSRSAAAAEKMRELGFMKVYELDGGMLQWKKDKMPVTKIPLDSAEISVDK